MASGQATAMCGSMEKGVEGAAEKVREAEKAETMKARKEGRDEDARDGSTSIYKIMGDDQAEEDEQRRRE